MYVYICGLNIPEISYISNQQTLPMTSAKLSRKVMTPVHFVPPEVQDDQLQQCSHKMSSNTGARKQNLGNLLHHYTYSISLFLNHAVQLILI